MQVNINKKTDFSDVAGFFDFWHFNEIDTVASARSERTAEQIAENIKQKQICKQFPDHCVQLLFLS